MADSIAYLRNVLYLVGLRKHIFPSVYNPYDAKTFIYFTVLVLAGLWCCCVGAPLSPKGSRVLKDEHRYHSYGDVVPAKYAVGKASVLRSTTPYTGQKIVLSSENPLLTIDYGTETSGIPFFDIATLSGGSQIEVKYSEQYAVS